MLFGLLCMLAMLSPLVPRAGDVVQGQPVFAEIAVFCRVYSDNQLRFRIGEATKGERAEILQDYSAESYFVRLNCGLEGWVNGKNLNIPPDLPTDTSNVCDGELEKFVNSKGYDSKTDFFVLVDINRQQTYVFSGEAGNWRYIQRFACSTGTNASPTTRGKFYITDRGDWFYSERLGAGGKYWMRFNGEYLFHSVPMDRDGRIIAGADVVGVRMSSGCVRLVVEDVKWIYDNVPDGSAVVVE